MALVKYATTGDYTDFVALMKRLKDTGDSRTVEDLFDSFNSAVDVLAPNAKVLTTAWKVKNYTIHKLTPCVAMADFDEVYAYRVPCKSKFPIYGIHADDDCKWWFSTVVYGNDNTYTMYECSIYENYVDIRYEDIGNLINFIKRRVNED